VKIKDKQFYTIEDIEKILLNLSNCKKYNKLADAYPEDKEEWLEDYDDVFSYTDGVISGNDYYFYVFDEKSNQDGIGGYNELFLQCSTKPNIPDRIFMLDAWGTCVDEVNQMVNKNIQYFIDLEK